MTITTINTIEALLQHVNSLKTAQKTIGVVPTMGALHEGHLSLVRQSLDQTDETIVTIFVNPTQFAPSEDLNQYPQTLAEDLALLESIGVKTVFAPTREEIYPPAFSTRVIAPGIAGNLEGEFRPTHFEGVITVVLKLLNLTQADQAFFGQKDFQQACVIQQMVADLNVPTRIIVCPIARAPDGLALSSRNVFLSADERQIALSLNQTLDLVEQQIKDGNRDGFELITEMRQSLIDAGVTRIDYAIVANPQTLVTCDPVSLPAVVLIAAHVGTTRLIDNRVLTDES